MVGRPPKYQYRVPTLPSKTDFETVIRQYRRAFQIVCKLSRLIHPPSSPPTPSHTTQPSKDNPQPSIMSANGSGNGNVTSGNEPPAASTSSGRRLPRTQPSNSAADTTPTPTSTPQPMVRYQMLATIVTLRRTAQNTCVELGATAASWVVHHVGYYRGHPGEYPGYAIPWYAWVWWVSHLKIPDRAGMMRYQNTGVSWVSQV